jgi:hypothetical protein
MDFIQHWQTLTEILVVQLTTHNDLCSAIEILDFLLQVQAHDARS